MPPSSKVYEPCGPARLKEAQEILYISCRLCRMNLLVIHSLGRVSTYYNL
jgi:hypothetical protein